MPRHVIRLPNAFYCAMIQVIAIVCALLIAFSRAISQPSTADQVAQTPHNLSISGPGPVRAAEETRICVFCHTPHGADAVAPLWNRYATETAFEIYPSGGSMQSVPTQPNGSSRICLSCHDGTTALGLVRSEASTIAMYGVTPQGALPSGSSNLGLSLADDHPVSFVPSLEDQEVVLPGQSDPVQLDESGQVQCGSCHDPHDNSYGNFLVSDNTESTICRTCHQQAEWNVSAHGNPQSPQFHQMIDQACASCHVPHDAQSPRLLTYFEESLCMACHDGIQNATWEVSGATDLVTEFQKASIHPIALSSGIHDPGEGPLNSYPPPSEYLPEENPDALRHVECVDCHNSHSANNVDSPGGINGAMANLWGIAENGTKVDPATKEYQICLKCHSDSENRPEGQANMRLQFQTSNPSYHPVMAMGTNPEVPSLIAPWSETSILTCTDCHSNDDPQGPAGPHGSIYSPLLTDNYGQSNGQAESQFLFALCYRCHDRNVVMSESGPSFSEHNKHVRGERYSCFLCHDAHGSTQYTHLIRFDEAQPFIAPSSSGRLEYIDNGDGSGSCYINCHGENHNPETYAQGGR